MFSKTRLRVLCVYFPAMYLLSPEISKLSILNCNLTCLSDLEIVLGGKLAKPLALEDVILVRFCQLRVAVLSHLGHLQAKKESVLKNGAFCVFIASWCLPTNLVIKKINLPLQKINLQSVKHAVLKL